MEGKTEHRSAVYLSVYEESSTGLTHQETDYEELGKRSKCIGCMACMQICPCNAIQIIDKNNHVYHREKCAYCGLCEHVCPSGAIRFLSKSP
ncbi:MAG: 4Fe-4S binding protein [Holosporales bacterium]|nr:4Fe-4S binding protein [Holosporales bacterium]